MSWDPGHAPCSAAAHRLGTGATGRSSSEVARLRPCSPASWGGRGDPSVPRVRWRSGPALSPASLAKRTPAGAQAAATGGGGGDPAAGTRLAGAAGGRRGHTGL